ncbi:MAG: hypothetical protein HFH10_12680 [Dorea sp.]|nr:hypothetical protein [Dorea sp.]
MAEMKNLCGKSPVELHLKVRQEIEAREISTQQFIQQVIEEHFTEKGGQAGMAVRTLAVQVSEELFGRFKAAVAKKGCRQKDFLIAIIEKAIEEIEDEIQEGKEIETAESEPEEMDGEQGRAEPEVEPEGMESLDAEESGTGEMEAEAEEMEAEDTEEPDTEADEAEMEEIA